MLIPFARKATIPLILCLAATKASSANKHRPVEPSPAERYVREAEARGADSHTAQPGSLWSPGATLADLGRDPRASQVDDLITVLVSDRANAFATGGTKAARKSSAKYSVASAFGATRATGALSNLANTSGQYDLDGQGTTSRDTSLTTTLSARITKVLPNGYLVIEGVKQIAVNSENQTVTVRGVVRPLDVTPDNVIPSDRIAQMDVRVNGKGVVGDAIKRPFFLYRILLGLFPL